MHPREPKCLEIYSAINYNFEENVSKADGSHGWSSKVFDDQMRPFITEHPDAVIVNLGEGLETQRYRIDAPGVLWVAVDLPAGIEIRERFITANEQHLHVALSALDTAWFDAVPKGRAVFISAQGLFMYFIPQELSQLLGALVRRFPGVTLMFEHIPPSYQSAHSAQKGGRKLKHTVPRPCSGVFAATSYSRFSQHGWVHP